MFPFCIVVVWCFQEPFEMWIHGYYWGYGQNDTLKAEYSAVTELLNAA